MSTFIGGIQEVLQILKQGEVKQTISGSKGTYTFNYKSREYMGLCNIISDYNILVDVEKILELIEKLKLGSYWGVYWWYPMYGRDKEMVEEYVSVRIKALEEMIEHLSDNN